MKKLKYILIIPILIASYALWKLCKYWFKPTGGNEGWIAETQPSEPWQYWTDIFWKVFFTLYNGLEIHNAHYVPQDKETSFVTVANHESILDGFIMGLSVMRPLYIMVKKEAFEVPIKGFYLRKVLCYPVDRSKTDSTAIKTAFKYLSEGKCLGIFPEGTRNRKGFVSEFKPGAIKLAIKKKIPILPAYIANSHNITPIDCILPRPAKLKVIFLEPIDTKAELEAGKNEKDIIEMLYKRITDVGTQTMGYDVRDPEYLARLEQQSQAPLGVVSGK